MPGMSAPPAAVRFQIGVVALCAVGAVLLWGSWLIYGARIGTNICQHYMYVVGGANDSLAAWCEGRSWRGWLGGCLAAAAAALLVATLIALRTLRVIWLAVGTLVAAVAVWAGFALPQTLAGSDRTSERPVTPPTTSLSTPPPTAPGPPASPVPGAPSSSPAA
jgi:hypothetical protein